MDLVSQDAVRYMGVEKTLAGDPVQAFLPLYLTHEHFEHVKVRNISCQASKRLLSVFQGVSLNACTTAFEKCCTTISWFIMV